MTWILEALPWAAGAGALLAIVGVFLNPLGAMMLARDLGGALVGAARKAVAWARGPRNWWRVAATIAGTICLALGLALSDAHQQLSMAEERCAASLRDAGREASDAAAAARSSAAALGRCRDALAEEVGRKQRIEALAADAVADARADAADARDALKRWMADYNRRPDACRAAVLALDTVCQTITDY